MIPEVEGMKKIICVALSLMLFGCGRELIVVGSSGIKTYPTYGYFNEKQSRSKNVCYEVSFGNIVWSIILVETVVVPIYFIGFSLFNPVRLKKNDADNCSVDSE